MAASRLAPPAVAPPRRRLLELSRHLGLLESFFFFFLLAFQKVCIFWVGGVEGGLNVLMRAEGRGDAAALRSAVGLFLSRRRRLITMMASRGPINHPDWEIMC